MYYILPSFSRLAALSALFLLGTLFLAPRAQAQLDDAGEILRAGADDANLLMENYLKPFGAGFGADLNSGWFNSAAPYGRFGFDLRASASLAFVPDSDQIFDLAALPFQEINFIDGPTNQTPTIAGDDLPGPRIGRTVEFQGMEEELFAFEMPQGTGFPYVPSPMVQLTVGPGFDSDISVRFFPSVEVPDVASLGLWGIGLRHGLNQWIPGGDALPVDLSVQAGYTRLTADATFDVQPNVDNETYVPAGFEPGAGRWDGQGIDLESSAFTGNLLVGKQFPIISLFGGVGFQTASMSVTTPGSYPLTSPNPEYTPQQTGDPESDRPKRIESIESPLDLSLPGENSVHALAGFRIRLAILTISGSYTLANYPTANLGVGISFR